jgi:YcaO-like protein with predicted kinase domain
VFYSLSRDDRLGLSVLFCSGAGAHPSAEIAALRALTEVAQSRAGFICSMREDVSHRIRVFEGIDYATRRARLASWFDESRETCRFESLRSSHQESFNDQFRFLIRRLQAVDHNLLLSCTTLRKWPNLYAFRTYSPQLLPPHPEEEHQWKS